MNATALKPSNDQLIAALPATLRALAQRGVLRSFKRGTIILHEGDSSDLLFVLLDGSVKIYATDQSGREITYGIVGAGDYFGEMSLDGGPRSASAVTVAPAVCAVVSREGVRAHLSVDADFAMNLVVQVIRRARAATEAARGMALMDVYGRVAAHLEGESGAATLAAPVELYPITHQSIASRVGASREMVSRQLKDLEKGGYVKLGMKRITLLRKLPLRW